MRLRNMDVRALPACTFSGLDMKAGTISLMHSVVETEGHAGELGLGHGSAKPTSQSRSAPTALGLPPNIPRYLTIYASALGLGSIR